MTEWQLICSTKRAFLSDCSPTTRQTYSRCFAKFKTSCDVSWEWHRRLASALYRCDVANEKSTERPRWSDQSSAAGEQLTAIAADRSSSEGPSSGSWLSSPARPPSGRASERAGWSGCRPLRPGHTLTTFKSLVCDRVTACDRKCSGRVSRHGGRRHRLPVVDCWVREHAAWASWSSRL